MKIHTLNIKMDANFTYAMHEAMWQACSTSCGEVDSTAMKNVAYTLFNCARSEQNRELCEILGVGASIDEISNS